MAKSKCGWCGVFANMPAVGEPIDKLLDDNINEFRVTTTHKCDACGQLSLSYVVIADDEMGPGAGTGDRSARGRHRFASSNNMLSWYPPPQEATTYEHVPKHIASAATEAHKCLAFGTLRAAASMARSVIEATAKDRDIKNGTIQQKIEKMFEHGLIRPYIRDGAHEVRHFGNDMAHGDFADPISKSDVDLAISLMDQVLVEVYEGPGKVEKARAAREERRSAKKGEG